MPLIIERILRLSIKIYFDVLQAEKDIKIATLHFKIICKETTLVTY